MFGHRRDAQWTNPTRTTHANSCTAASAAKRRIMQTAYLTYMTMWSKRIRAVADRLDRTQPGDGDGRP